MRRSLLVLAMGALFASSAYADETFKVGTLTYNVTSATTVEVSKAASTDDDGATVTSYTVPASVQDESGKSYNVTAIGEAAFKWSKAVSVVLPEGIDSLKYGAFNSASSLVSLNLPSTLKYIGDYALSSTVLTSIEIPASVEEIGNSAFFTCKSLTSIKFNEGLKKIGPSAFYKCAFTSASLPESLVDLGKKAFLYCEKLTNVTLPSSLTALPEGLFNYCTKLSSVKIAEGVKSIGDECFLHCESLTSVALPASLETLGTSVFAYTGIKDITVASGNTNFTVDGGVLYGADKKLLYAAPMSGVSQVEVDSKCIGINGGAFWGSAVSKVTLPEGFLAIDDYAFCQSSLAEINFPSSITFIGEQGFAATQLTEVVLPENMTYIQDGVFAGCTKLTKVTIPSAVTMVYNHAFNGDSNLASVTCLGTTAPAIDDVYDTYDSPFYGVSTTTPLYVPKGSADSYKSAGWGSYLTITETENSVVGLVSASPADGTTFAKYCYMTVDLTFDSDVTVVVDKPEVYIRQGNELSGATKTPYDGWHVTASSSDSKKVTVWGDDGDGSVDMFKTVEGGEYYFIIPAGIVKNANGDLNERIVIKWYGPAAPKYVSLVSADPADGTVLKTYADMSVSLTFDADVTIANSSPSVQLLKDDKEMGDEIKPTGSWHVNAGSSNTTVTVWGDDGDGYTDYFKTTEGAEYYLVIPAGIVKNEAGDLNQEITIKWNGPEAQKKQALSIVSIDPADGSTFSKYCYMTAEVKFNSDVTIVVDKPEATIRQDDPYTGTLKSPYDGWHVTATSDNTTVRIWGDDGDGSVDYFTTEQGAEYYFTIPAGIVKNADGTLNDKYIIVWNGPAAPKALTVASTTPANGATLTGSYADMAFDITFSDDVTVLDYGPSAVLREGDAETGTKIEPDLYWKVTKYDSDAKTIRVWGADYDYAVQTFALKEGAKYYMTIPAGIVQNSDGSKNEQIVIEFNGPAPASAGLSVVSTTPANGATVEPGYRDMKCYVEFSEAITIAKSSPSIVLRKNDPTSGSKVSTMGWWRAQKDGTNTLYLWADDSDGYVDTYKAEEGTTYYLTIPAGVVKNAAGDANEQIVIEYTCSSATGIEGVDGNSAVEVGRYDIGGRRVNENQKGIIIIRFSDGSARKAYIK